MRTIHANDENAVKDLAAQLAQISRAGDVIALYGDLGVGKTVFARAFVQSLALPDEDVPSPTFTLAQMYDGEKADGTPLAVYHFDLYRLKNPEEIYEIGFEEALSGGVSLIEWPQKAGGLLPKNRLEIHIDAPDATTKRVLTMIPHGKRYETEKFYQCPTTA